MHFLDVSLQVSKALQALIAVFAIGRYGVMLSAMDLLHVSHENRVRVGAVDAEVAPEAAFRTVRNPGVPVNLCLLVGRVGTRLASEGEDFAVNISSEILILLI